MYTPATVSAARRNAMSDGSCCDADNTYAAWVLKGKKRKGKNTERRKT